MAPKVRITKDAIVSAALDQVRRNGEQGLNARSVAAALGCSTQPIFSNFATMDELKAAVVAAAGTLFMDYIDRETARGDYPSYKASGMAYIRFAQEEKELFKLLYMRDRTDESFQQDDQLTYKEAGMVQEVAGLSKEDSLLFHLEMWAYVHGIAAMYATGFLSLDWDLISRMLTDAYQGHLKRFKEE